MDLVTNSIPTPSVLKIFFSFLLTNGVNSKAEVAFSVVISILSNYKRVQINTIIRGII